MQIQSSTAERVIRYLPAANADIPRDYEQPIRQAAFKEGISVSEWCRRALIAAALEKAS